MSNGKKKLNHIKNSKGDRLFLFIVYAAVTLVVLMCAYPLYLTIIASISEKDMTPSTTALRII